ncbi:MAG: hypothetical protein HY000_13315 [Planctomycetes bacterium]|nr:hypothetical protein [Planctomycetota bacterium]
MHRDDDELRVFQQIVAGFDTPAFLRRARRVADAWQVLVEQCRSRREAWLELPKLRLGTLVALAGDWDAVGQLLADTGDAQYLREMFDQWRPELRMPVAPTNSVRMLRVAAQQMNASFARFNRRWEQFIAELDLMEINRLRAGYNQYYVLEKECIVRSARIAREGFRPLPPATTDDLLALFPTLQVPPLQD